MVDVTPMSDASPPTAARPWLAAYPPGVSADLPPLPFRSLAQLIVESSRTFGHAPAFSTCLPNGFNGGLTFAEVDWLSDAFAAYLRHDLVLSPGSRVALQAPNCLSYPVVAFGVFKAGCVLVNTNPLYTAPEILRQFADAQVSAVVVVDLFADRLQAVLPDLGNPPVVLVRIDEFFPGYVSGIVRAVQRWWNRALPKVRYPATRLADALAAGAAHGADTASYWADLGPDDVAALQYTGGTTGVSKGAMLTHGNLLTNCEQMLQMVGTHVRPGAETVLTPLPLYHVFAFTVNLLAFYRRGAHNVLIPNPRPLSNLKRAWENFPIADNQGPSTPMGQERWSVGVTFAGRSAGTPGKGVNASHAPR